MKKRLAIVSAALLLAQVWSTPTEAATRIVPSQKYPTIQSAITAAKAGDTVQVSGGVYRENISFLGKNVRVVSANGALDAAGNALTTIDGNGAWDSVVTFTGGETADTLLEGFVITGGRGKGNGYYFGGGIHALSSSPTIRNCVIRGNTANLGAGIYLEASSAIVAGCRIEDNTATRAANGTRGSGGGLFFWQGAATVDGCVVRGNVAEAGGGAYSYFAGTTIKNSLVVENRADGANGGTGGGIYLSGGGLGAYYTTVANNSATEAGGAYAHYGSQSYNNSIMYFNQPDQTTGSDGGGVVFRHSDIQGGSAGEGNIDVDPLFTQGGSGMYASAYYLQGISPCVDAASLAWGAEISTDILGRARSQDGDGDGTVAPDMGPYELDAAPVLHISQALYDYVGDALAVEASSPSGAAAALELTTDGVGRGPMTWDSTRLLWWSSVPLSSPPALITVCGVDGCTSAQ